MSPDLEPAALAASTAVAEALIEPHAVRFSAERGRAQPQSLAGGPLGVALLHIERVLSGHGDEATMHSWLVEAVREPVSAGNNADLFHGSPALGFVLHTAAAATGRYRRALTAVDDRTIAITRARLTAAHARIDRGDQPSMHECDLVHGLAGLGVYHLRRWPDRPITADVLAYLVRLVQPLPGAADGLPPWWLSTGLNGAPSLEYPHGHGNFGVSHGISGAIALLSLAILRDLPVAGARAALAGLVAWTDQWRHANIDTPWWPGYITLDHVRCADQPKRPRPSWCYGIGGTARAQQLAGMALRDPARQSVAETAMIAALRDPAQRALLPGIGLCHGKAGLLQAAWRMAMDAQNPHLADELPHLTAQLTDQLTSGPVGDPELMDGAAGAALALHTAGTSTIASDWDTFLLLA